MIQVHLYRTQYIPLNQKLYKNFYIKKHSRASVNTRSKSTTFIQNCLHTYNIKRKPESKREEGEEEVKQCCINILLFYFCYFFSSLYLIKNF